MTQSRVLPSLQGHYGIHYPDHDAAALTLSEDVKLELLPWAAQSGWRAYLAREGDKTKVVWLRS